MVSDVRPTIFALSSGRPPAAIAVVRMSGRAPAMRSRRSAASARAAQGSAGARARSAERRCIDEALALWFPGPSSETGEDMAELQLHGGRGDLRQC